jgi:hypothetical protein
MTSSREQKDHTIVGFLLAGFLVLCFYGYKGFRAVFNPKEPIEDTYVITVHTVVPLKPVYLGGYLQTGLPTQEDDYTVVYGVDVLKVKYASSQTSSAKPGDPPGSRLHEHRNIFDDPDLSQVPHVGVPIRRCKLSKDVMPDGSPLIATQPTPEPCMVQIGDTLQYLPSPNSGDFTYVDFDVLSESVRCQGVDRRACSI